MRSAVIASSCCKPYGPLSCGGRIPESSLDCSWTIGPKTWLLLWWSALSLIYSYKALLQFNRNGSRYFSCVFAAKVNPCIMLTYGWVHLSDLNSKQALCIGHIGGCLEADVKRQVTGLCHIAIVKCVYVVSPNCSNSLREGVHWFPSSPWRAATQSTHINSRACIYTFAQICQVQSFVYSTVHMGHTKWIINDTHSSLPFFLLHVMSESYFWK